MKKLFFMALLMSSFASYGNELSTLTTYVNLAKGFSPAFYEDVMANLKTTKDVCDNAPKQKKALIKELTSGGLSTKDYFRKKEQLKQIPNSVIQSLDRQIRKLN